jgi:DNA invertase Pin-like site-specific DNA recombinase
MRRKDKTTEHDNLTVEGGDAIAYSYLRFSSPAQAEGDSVRRQTALRDAWLKRHPQVRLDTSLRLKDEGVSGYGDEHRTNPKHALAQFLALVERDRIPVGSYLIVENLDRLTRENPIVSIPAVLNLIAAGIRIVQLAPVEIVYDTNMEQHQLMNMLWELARGHGESKRKSGLCGEAWQEKKEQARKDKTPYGRMCPAWLELVDGAYRVKADAAKTVRAIFEWSAAGLGTFATLERLNREYTPAIGRTGRWERSYLKKLLKNRAVLGEYQPHKGSRGPGRQAEGEPIAGYYPRIIDEELFYRAQQASKARTKCSGRPASASNNPFSGLLYDALDGSKLHACSTNGPKYRYLVSSAAVQKVEGAQWRTFPLAPFTAALLSELQELQASALFADPGAERLTVLNGRLEEVDKRLAVALSKFEADPESPTWAAKVDQYDKEKRALVAELAEALRQATHPLSASWVEAVELMASNDPQRLRAALLETIDSIWCVFTSRGAVRLARVQVWFKGRDGEEPRIPFTVAAADEPGSTVFSIDGEVVGSYRSYLIIHRAGTGGMAGQRPARYAVKSIKQPDAFRNLAPFDLDDLRDRRQARNVLSMLDDMPPAMIEALLAEGADIGG